MKRACRRDVLTIKHASGRQLYRNWRLEFNWDGLLGRLQLGLFDFHHFWGNLGFGPLDDTVLGTLAAADQRKEEGETEHGKSCFSHLGELSGGGA